MKIAVLFYGITRGLEFTSKSIEKNVLSPLKNIADVDVYGAFYKVNKIEGGRSKENINFDSANYKILSFNKVTMLEKKDKTDKLFKEISVFGDYWQDSYVSLLNITMQLDSIKKCWDSIENKNYDQYYFLRPDLEYHDSFLSIFDKLITENSIAVIPKWQNWGGYNDRFICTNDHKIASAISNRVERMYDYSNSQMAPFHSESFLKWLLDKDNIKVKFTKIRATRVRADGTRKNESFSCIGNNKNFQKFKFYLGQFKSSFFKV